MKILAEFKVSPRILPDNLFQVKYKLEVNKVTVHYYEIRIRHINETINQEAINDFKSVCYNQLLSYLLLVRLPVWKESIEDLHYKINKQNGTN